MCVGQAYSRMDPGKKSGGQDEEYLDVAAVTRVRVAGGGSVYGLPELSFIESGCMCERRLGIMGNRSEQRDR